MLDDHSENRPIIILLTCHYFRHTLSTITLSVSRYRRRHSSFHRFTNWQATVSGFYTGFSNRGRGVIKFSGVGGVCDRGFEGANGVTSGLFSGIIFVQNLG